MKKTPRFVILSEDGQPIRAFWVKSAALLFMRPDQGETLKVIPKPTKEKIVVSTFEALF